VVEHDVVHGDRVRVLQTCRDATFPHRTLDGFLRFVRRHVVQQHLLDGDIPMQELVPRTPHDAHRAGTELVEQDVAVAKLVHARTVPNAPVERSEYRRDRPAAVDIAADMKWSCDGERPWTHTVLKVCDRHRRGTDLQGVTRRSTT
jgi:hypothetical protein